MGQAHPALLCACGERHQGGTAGLPILDPVDFATAAAAAAHEREVHFLPRTRRPTLETFLPGNDLVMRRPAKVSHRISPSPRQAAPRL